MARYTYDQLKTNENERAKLLNTLKALQEQAERWKPEAPAEEEKAPQEEMAKSLLDKIGQVEELLNKSAPKGEEKMQRAAFDKALEELSGSMKAIRHDSELGELFNKAREQAPELDDVAAGIGLARENTVDYIAEHYRTIANTDYASLTPDQKMSCVAGFLALHELVGNEKAPGEKQVDLKTFEKQHVEPMAERLAQFSKLHFGDKDSRPYLPLYYIIFSTVVASVYAFLAAQRDQSDEYEAQMMERSRIETELNMAAGIQTHMLPSIFPAFPNREEFDIYATMQPAKEVGGDFFDFFMVDEDHLAIVVADVSGKGVPAALFSMIAKTLLKTKTQSKLSVEEVLREANASLCENNDEEMFVTVWLGVLEISTGTLSCADAGHEKLLLYQDGKWSFFPKKSGCALAAYTPEDMELLGDEIGFYGQTVHLRPGDAIFQYTDGVTEAMNAEEELFGEERLLSAMNAAPSAKPEELLPYVRGCIDAFVKDAPQFDDITMLGLRMNG